FESTPGLTNQCSCETSDIALFTISVFALNIPETFAKSVCMQHSLKQEIINLQAHFASCLSGARRPTPEAKTSEPDVSSKTESRFLIFMIRLTSLVTFLSLNSIPFD